MTSGVEGLASKIERVGAAARLSDLALFMREGEAARAHRIKKVLECLDPGVYLVGAGPYTQGVYSLMCDEVVIGRLATVVEESAGSPVDVFVNDASSLMPREVSRVHCAIYRREGVIRHDYWIVDKGSTCGTLLNDEELPHSSQLNTDDLRLASRALTNGDVISLGKSRVNCFVFLDLRK